MEINLSEEMREFLIKTLQAKKVRLLKKEVVKGPDPYISETLDQAVERKLLRKEWEEKMSMTEQALSMLTE